MGGSQAPFAVFRKKSSGRANRQVCAAQAPKGPNSLLFNATYSRFGISGLVQGLEYRMVSVILTNCGLRDSETGHFTPDRCRGTIHRVASPLVFLFLITQL